MLTFQRRGDQKKPDTAVIESAELMISNSERKDAHQIVGKVGNRWANTGVKGAIEQYEQDAREYRQAQGTASEKRLGGLESALTLYILTVVNGDIRTLLERYRKDGVRVQRGSHPLLSILRAGFAPNRGLGRPLG